MKKFLSISVCVLASLTANAGIKMTKASDGIKDSIYVESTFSAEEAASALQGLTGSQSATLKIATAENYGLTESDWTDICDKIISNNNKVTTVDLTDARFDKQLGTNGNLLGGKLTSYNKNNVDKVVWSRYADVPASCFQNKSKIVSITIPDQKKGEKSTIIIGHDAFQGMAALEKLYIGNCVTSIGENICQEDRKLTTVTFNTPQVKIVPNKSFQNCSSLELIDLPRNVNVIGKEAFEHTPLQTITFPNTLTTICENAFYDCDLTYVVIPENVETIENEAFQQNALLKDVYVMGNKAKCSAKGFDKQQMCLNFKNTNKESGVSPEHPATRDDWKIGDKNIIVLHFVATTDNDFEKYENPYWIMLNTEGILEEIKECNTEEKKTAFKTKYNLQSVFPNDLQTYAQNPDSDCPFAYIKYKDNKGKEKAIRIWREGTYYYNNLEDLQTAGDEFAGWKQFLIIQDDAIQSVFEDKNRVDDRWYSMCFPFDMTAKQIRTAYGAETEVCEFLGIWESKDEKKNEVYTFRFKPLMDTSSAENDAKITTANRSYMIHPSSKKETDSDIFTRIIPNISKDEQSTTGKTPIPTRPEESNNAQQANNYTEGTLVTGFEFVGNYQEGVKLPAESNYFTYKNGTDGSRTLILNHLTKESTHNWTPMTALVRPYDSVASHILNAKKLSFSFDTKEKNETTGIEDNLTDAVNKSLYSTNRIYSLSGQMVKEGTSLEGLSKGIYIVNGKKIVVK